MKYAFNIASNNPVVNAGISYGIFLLYSEDMLEVIPAIIAKNFEDVKEKIKLVEPHVRWVHVDVMDGKFVTNVTWNHPAELRGYIPQVSLGAHLMINEPEKYVEEWIEAGIKRIIFHIEATQNPQDIINLCREKGVEVGVAINPETSLEAIRDITGSDPIISVNMVLVMGVNPGAGGQEFEPEVVSKIRALRKMYPNLTIGVDGGVNPETARQVIEAGASVIVAGSYIFGSKNIEKAISELNNS